MLTNIKMITLYKYSRIDKNLIHGLSCKTNWISDPKSFNDPFEFVSRAEFDLTESGISRHDYENIRYKKFIESTAERYGIVSYSELGTNNALMWSHYADHHRGLCLIFEINEKENPDLYKVKYKKILPKLDYTKSESAFRKNLVNIATTKSVDWNYEKEWREVFTVKNRSIAYPGELKRIVFGCRCPVNDMRIIWNIVIPLYEKEVEFSKVCRQEGTFQLLSIIHPKEFNVLDKFPEDLNCMQ